MSVAAQSDRCHSLFSSSPQAGARNPDWLKELIALRQDIQKNNGALGVALRTEWQDRVNQLSLEDRRSLADALRALVEKPDGKTKDEEARQRKAQKDATQNLRIDGNRAILHRVEPGQFKMGKAGKKVDVTLTQPFDMMATPTTQIIWKIVAELTNFRFGPRNSRIGYRLINADPSHFKGDTRPVESVSLDDIEMWIHGLNELSQAGEAALADLIPGHKQGDVYRLPTEAEWEFVVRGRGEYNGTYHFGNDETQIGKYTWYAENSGNQTQPVALKAPLVIDGHEFYDMHGNVNEFVQDQYEKNLSGGVDPKGPTEEFNYVLRGGSGMDGLNPSFLTSSFRSSTDPYDTNLWSGFRFVRSAR